MAIPSRRAIRNAIPLYAGEVASRLLTFALFIVAARYLDPAQYGHLAFAIAILTLATLGSEFGTGTLVTKRVAQDPANAARHVVSAVIARWLLGVPAYSAAVLYAAATSTREVQIFVALVSLATLFTFHSGPVGAALRGLNRTGWEAALRIVNTLAFVAVSLFALASGRGLLGIAIGHVAGMMISGVAAAACGFRFGILSFCRTSGLWEFLRASAPFGLQSVLVILYLRAGFLLLEGLSGARELGLYSAASRLVEPLIVLPQLFAAALFPVITQVLASGDRAAARNLLSASMRFFFAIALPLSVVLCMASSRIVGILYSPDQYGASADVLRILCWALPAAFLGVFPTVLISSSARPGINTWISAAVLAENVLLNLILIPRWGAPGAAAAFVATEVTALLVAIPFLRREIREFRAFPAVAPPLAAAAVASAILLIRSPSSLPAFVGAYPALLLLFDRKGTYRKILGAGIRALRPSAADGAADAVAVPAAAPMDEPPLRK